MQLQRRIRVPILFIVFTACLSSCKLFQEESQKTIRQDFYAIQPGTLLEVLPNGDTNTFVAITEQDIDYSAPTGSPVHWSQSNYFQIIEAFYKLVLNDQLDNWQLSSLSFSLDCAHVGIGFQDGRFEYFKIIKNEYNQEVRVSRLIDIDPRYEIVLFWETEFSPYIVERSSIDPEKTNIEAERMLQIAEDSGGRNQRLPLKNACSITLGLWPDTANYRGWNVTYVRDDSNLPAFQINIDPDTETIQ